MGSSRLSLRTRNWRGGAPGGRYEGPGEVRRETPAQGLMPLRSDRTADHLLQRFRRDIHSSTRELCVPSLDSWWSPPVSRYVLHVEEGHQRPV